MKKVLLISLLLLGGCTSKDQSIESLTVTIDGKTVTKVTGEYGKVNVWKLYERLYGPLTASCELAEFMKQDVSRLSTHTNGTVSETSVTSSSVTSNVSLNLVTTEFEAVARIKDAESKIPHGIDYSAPSKLIKLLINEYEMIQSATFVHTSSGYDESENKFLKSMSVFKATPSSITCETQLDVTSKRPDQ